MSEMLLTISMLVGLIFLAVSSFFYSFGGRAGTSKAWRRFLAPTLTCIGLNTVLLVQLSWTWQSCLGSILASLMLCLGYCCGYGGDTVGRRLFRRSIIAIIYIIAGLAVCLFTGRWNSFVVHCCLCIYTIVYAVHNELPAAIEETQIGLFSQLMLYFMI